MKFLVICWLFASLSCNIRVSAQIFGGAREPEPLEQKVQPLAGVQTLYFRQKLNHFTQDNPTYWWQRFHVNEDIWRRAANSPVFIMVGGEGEISPGWMTGGAWVYWAYRYGALLFQLEHRFYGQSKPTGDASTNNLQYLRSQQALGDLANFIQSMNSIYKLTSNNKWIVFGGSYPGNLAAWARLKLPSIVSASISSSAPLQAKVNFYEYDDVVRDSLDTISGGCSYQVYRAMKNMQEMFKTNAGAQTLINKFNICGGFSASRPDDIRMFYLSIFSYIARAVQYNNDANDKEKISFVCSYMNNGNVPDPVDRWAQLVKANTNGCMFGSYQGAISYWQGSAWDSGAVTSSGRQWIFQTCNEFGYYQTSPWANSPLSDTIPVDLFTRQCTDIFGSNYNAGQLDRAVDFTNQYYGGTNIKMDRIVFVQGSIDPWHALGMARNLPRESALLYIQGTSHCQDMNTPNDRDSQNLKNTRANMQQWLDYFIL